MSKSEDLRRRAEKLEMASFQELWTLAAQCGSEIADLMPQKRRPWISEIIQELFHEQQGKCALCGQALALESLHVDHRIPFCYGGGNERNNLQLAHDHCNLQKKAQVRPRDLIRYLEDKMMNLPPL